LLFCLVKALNNFEYIFNRLFNYFFLFIEEAAAFAGWKKKAWTKRLGLKKITASPTPPLCSLYFLYFLGYLGLRKRISTNFFFKISRFREEFLSKKIYYFYGAGFYFFKLFALKFFFFFLSVAVFLYTQLALEVLPLAKIFFTWLSVFFFLYLLLSGFVFFLKRYNFSKFTTIISRFWKRSFSIFWLLEGFIFVCFIYLTFNSSSEVLYFYDHQALFKSHLFSFRIFFFKLLLITAIILLVYYLLGSFEFLKPGTCSLFIMLISALVLYITWVEFTQFFHFINFCDYFTWNYNADSYEWVLENEFRKTRIVNNYVLVCVVAKFWHLIIIVLIWFFSANRLLENSDSREYLFSANLQNFIILYLLNWIAMYPWFKFILRKYLNISYLWFSAQFRERFFLNFFNGFYSVVALAF